MFRAFASALALLTVLVFTTLSAPATAQGDRNTEIAREKFTKGVDAYDAGNYEKARTLFLQAYALKRHPLVLLNLGQSELKGAHYEDAGNHFQQFLRDHRTATPEQKRDAESGIAEAQKKTGYVILIVDTDGAKLRIDGTFIGKSPLADPYFVKPGKHVATAKKGKKKVKVEVDVRRGTATPVTLNLGGGGGAAVVPVPTPAPAISPNPVPAPYPAAPQPLPYPAPVMPAPMPGFRGGMPPGGDTGSDGFLDWAVPRWGAWALAGGATVGLIGTIVFGALAGSRNSNADSVSGQILTEVQAGEEGKAEAKLPPQFWSNGDGTGAPQPCGTLDDTNSGFAHYAQACNSLRAEINAYDELLIGVAVMVPVFVASTAGLLVYYFVDTADDNNGSARSFTLLPTPIITPTTQGAGLVGTF